MLKRDELIPLKIDKRLLRGEPGLGFGPRPFSQKDDFAGHRIPCATMLYRDPALRRASGNIHFNPAVEPPPFLPVSGGKCGVGKAPSTVLATISLDPLGILSAIIMAIFDNARASAAVAIRVHSVEPPCSIEQKKYTRLFTTTPKWTS